MTEPGDTPNPVPPSTSMETPSRRLRWLILVVVVAGTASATWFLSQKTPPEQPTPPAKDRSLPLPAVSSSPFLNTRADVRYVGSAACRSCHESHILSFHRTGMGRSMALVDPEREPPDATYDHPPSKGRYQVLRKEGQLWHRELLLRDGPEEVVLNEFPVKYVVGSGRAARTYLVEADGFLVESPITWHRSKKGWDMSPGYDRPNHSGFEREVGESCLVCHAGQARALGGSVHRMEVKEPAISCERCHGPGELHVRQHTGKVRDWEAGAIDHTIVNPAHLSRELAEAVCQQCHLRSSGKVLVRGRSFADFRPGLPLQDFRHDYRLDTEDAAMTVVGHVEQMHLSRCYKGSKSFTCTTCHDPHTEPSPPRQEAYYRKVCLECHQAEHCKVDPATRSKQSPSNNCVHCHMPSAPTDVTHVAFTQHKVGIYDPANAPPEHRGKGPATFSPLVPFLDLAGASDIDRRRSLGMANIEIAEKCRDRELAGKYFERGFRLLNEVHTEGLEDGDLLATLARFRHMRKQDGVLPLADKALAAGFSDPQNRAIAYHLAADSLARAGRHKEALPLLRELPPLRRLSSQMLLLGQCEQAVGVPGAIERFEAAVRINPRLFSIHGQLAGVFRKKGEREKADFHAKRAGP